nr:alanine racemase [Sphingomonas oleivorans]
MNISDLQTPCLLLELRKLNANLDRMAQRVDALGVRLRPHAKTAKSIDVLDRALGSGTGGITVSTLREAEYFLDHGITDILYAVAIAPAKLATAADLMRRGADLKILVESAETARIVSTEGRRAGLRYKAFVEIDSDGHRAGVRPASAELLEVADALDGVGAELSGVLTHAGSSYHCDDTAEIARIAASEREAVVRSAEFLRQAGHSCPEISLGSTPTITFASDLAGVTEARVGVYMFQDLVMAGLGVCAVEDIALSVLATIIGHRRDTGAPIIDAGWMALSRDRGTSMQKIDQGYGIVCDELGAVLPDMIVVAANQEHGIVGRRDGGMIDPSLFPVGKRLRILPNHACATAAAHDAFHVVGPDGTVEAAWPRCRGW